MLAVCPDATCFIGPHRIYDPFTKSFMNLIPGQGHCKRRSQTLPTPTAFFCGIHAHSVTLCLRSWSRRDSRRCALASRRVGLAQDGPRYHGSAGARSARPDGLHGPLNDILSQKKTPGHNDTGNNKNNKTQTPVRLSLHACFTVWVGGTRSFQISVVAYALFGRHFQNLVLQGV